MWPYHVTMILAEGDGISLGIYLKDRSGNLWAVNEYTEWTLLDVSVPWLIFPVAVPQ